jgi:FKBP-type peptidyl-prolyl cis-trans isomerase
MKMHMAEGAKALEEGKKFLAENGKKSGVKTTASGLQYEVIKEGSGAKPLATDTVEVNYKGTTIEGKVFDSNEGKPSVKFPVNRVIPGWTEALQLMTVGSKYKLYLPAALGYGEQSPNPEIKPNSVLIFEVELLNIKK